MVCVRLLSVLALTTVMLGPVHAAEDSIAPAAVAAPEQCGGNDMLAEMATQNPGDHRRIMDEAAALENANAVLWKIEKPGVAPSYLFGTIHMADKRVTSLSDTVSKAAGSAKTVALEVAKTSGASVLEAMAKVPDLLAYTDGTTLQAQLTGDEFKKVQAFVAKSGMPPEAAIVLKPWLVSMMLAVSDCQRQQLAAGADALDSRLEKQAEQRGATVVGLETADSQLKAMASVPNDQQILMLKSSLAYIDRTDDMIETLVQLYLKRQLGATMPFQKILAEKSGVPASAFEGFNKILLIDRNAKMRDAALPLFEKGDAFVAVGALHLSGKTGLVALLRDAGYTVTAVE